MKFWICFQHEKMVTINADSLDRMRRLFSRVQISVKAWKVAAGNLQAQFVPGPADFKLVVSSLQSSDR